MMFLRAIDKLDRLGWDEVNKLLGPGRMDESGDFTEGCGLSEDQIEALGYFFKWTKWENCKSNEVVLSKMASWFNIMHMPLDK